MPRKRLVVGRLYRIYLYFQGCYTREQVENARLIVLELAEMLSARAGKSVSVYLGANWGQICGSGNIATLYSLLNGKRLRQRLFKGSSRKFSHWEI